MIGDPPVGDLADHEDCHDQEDDLEPIHRRSSPYDADLRVPHPRLEGLTGCAPGTGTMARTSPITTRLSTFLIRAAGLTMILWASVASASILTSSGVTKSRPCRAAQARVALY